MAPVFSSRDLPLGERRGLWLDVCGLAGGDTVRLPLLVARGERDGPTVVVLGGVHGDEYEGMAAVRDVFRGIEPGEMRGTFVGAPVCNPPAFAVGTRTSPIDGQNLARVFPGRADGTVSERVAHVIENQVTKHADFLIDLHTAGSRLAMPLLVGYSHGEEERDRRSREAALRFGAPVVWGHPSVGEGRSLSGPHGRGVPWLYTESPTGGWLHPEIVDVYARGVVNVMRYLGILEGEAPVVVPERELLGEGDTDKSLTAPVSGFLVPMVDLLARVAVGDLLGVVQGMDGETLAEMRAPTAGTVVLRRNSPPVAAGDLAFLLT